jgi:hypothetical protein
MRRTSRLLVYAVLLGLVVGGAPVPAHAAPQRLGQLQGIVLGLDGRPAAGHRIHLIDAEGRDVAQATTAANGQYAFHELRAGDYSLGVETPAGEIAPVVAPPMRLDPGQLARRDIALSPASPTQPGPQQVANYGLGAWWAGLSTSARVWTVVGLVTVVGITWAAVDDDDDDDEPPASPN